MIVASLPKCRSNIYPWNYSGRVMSAWKVSKWSAACAGSLDAYSGAGILSFVRVARTEPCSHDRRPPTFTIVVVESCLAYRMQICLKMTVTN